MRFVQLDKLENYLFSRGFHKTDKTFDYPSPVWQQVLFYRNSENREIRVTVFCEPHKMPLVHGNNVVSILDDEVYVPIDFRKKIWKELSIKSQKEK